MKFLIFGDFHIHNVTNNDRFGDYMSTLKQIKRMVNKHKIDIIVCVGDFFHNRKSLEVKLLYEVSNFFATEWKFRRGTPGNALEDIPVVTNWVVGNHDCATWRGAENSLTPMFEGLDNFRVIDRAQRFYHTRYNLYPFNQKLTCIYMPHFEKEEIGGMLSEVCELARENKAQGDKVVLFSHFGVSEAKINEYSDENYEDDEYIVSQADLTIFDRVFLGHYHIPQRLCNGRIAYTGSALPQDRGDVGARGVIVYDSETDDYDWDWIDAPQFFTIEQGEKLEISEEEIKNSYFKIIKGSNDKIDKELVKKLKAMGARVVDFKDRDEVVSKKRMAVMENGKQRTASENMQWYITNKGIELDKESLLWQIGKGLFLGKNIDEILKDREIS